MSKTTANSSESIGYRELIRGNRNFRLLWLGQIISLLGDWFNFVASASLIAILTQSGFAVGSLFVVRMLAPFFISPIAGVVADRYNRKHTLIITDLARVIVAFGFLLVRSADHVWLLYVLTALQLGIGGFFFPTRNAILPDVVSSQELGAANALGSATWSVMLALGAAIGGIVSGAWGIYPAFVIDGLTFLLSAAFIARIKLDVEPSLAASDKTMGGAFKEYLDGLRYLGRHTDTLVIALHKGASALMMGSGSQVAMVVIAKDIFVIGEGGGISLGLMLGMGGIGTGVGPIVARRFTGDRDRPFAVCHHFGLSDGCYRASYRRSDAPIRLGAFGCHTPWDWWGNCLGVLDTTVIASRSQSRARTGLLHRLCPFHADECCRFCGRWRGTRRFTEHPYNFLVDGGFDGDPSGSVGNMAGQKNKTQNVKRNARTQRLKKWLM